MARRAYARLHMGAFASATLLSGSALAQQAAQPAQELPAVEVLANKKVVAKTAKKEVTTVQAKKQAAPAPQPTAPADAPSADGGRENAADVASELRDSTTGTSTLSAQDVARSGESKVYDVLTSLPNVTPAPSGPTLPAIRGESATPTNLFGGYYNGSTPRMVLHVDDIPRISSYANNAFQSLFDVQSIQVLRGPQHTLPGTNAFAGAYVIETNDPEYRYSAETLTEFTYNEYSGTNHRYAGLANVPFSNEAAMRIVAQFESGEIPVELVGPAPAGKDLNKLDDFDGLNLRGKFLVEPDNIPGLSVLVSAEYGKGLDNVFDSYVDVRPFSDRKRTAADHRINDTEGWAGAVRARYEISSREVIQSTTSFVHDQYESSPRSTSNFNFNGMVDERAAQDVSYSFRDIANFTGIVGVGVTDSKRDYDADASFVIPIGPGVFGAFTAYGKTDAEIQTQSVYADIAWNFAGPFDLLFGGRIERVDDSRDFSAGSRSAIPFLRAARNYSYDETEVFVLPKAGLRYNLGPRDTVAVTARKGYNAGGAYVNLQDATLRFPFETFKAEEVWTYEAAYRTAMMRDRLKLGITAFFNDYENKQFAISNPSTAPPRIFNEPEAESYGIEVEAKYAVTPAIDLMGGFGILQTRINKVSAQTQPQIIGNDFGQDPSYSVSLGGAWRPVDNLELYAKGVYVDDYFTDFRNATLNVAGGYTLVDVGASYQVGKNATARVFVNNLTDETAYSTLILNTGSPNATLLDPRTYGASLALKF